MVPKIHMTNQVAELEKIMEANPLCDIIEVPIYKYLFTQQYSTIVSNYDFYLVRSDMFRLLMQPSSGQLKVEQES